MSLVRPYSPLVCLGLLLALSRQASGDESPAKGELAKKYRAHVRQLVSPNKKPITKNGDGGSVKFPVGYDVAAQNRINAARQALHDNFEEVLPFLVEALDDKRYSMTIDWAEGDAYYNYSVSEICRDMIASQLEVYRDAISFSGPGHWHQYDYRAISKEWWKTRQGRSLAELQIEAIDWAIKWREAEPKEYVRPDRKDEIAGLKKLRDEIAKSGKPAKPLRMLPMVTSDKR